EERRLLYVASTRAEKQLVISVGGDKASPFLNEVNRFLYTNAFTLQGLFGDMPGSGIPRIGIEQEVEEEKFVEHPIFGRGKIVNAIDKEKLIVAFEERGEKTIDTSIVAVKYL
ncbi:MAG: DUF3553 domain-containing protein, partial [bacterium]|nr:DUF3553 domain-containing protein [bacterium]